MTVKGAPVEEELKFDVDPEFVLPDLSACLPPGARIGTRPPVTLRATYYDTADLRLARAGVSLRYRDGDGGDPWTVKLPTDVPGSRHEIDRPGSRSTIPAELVALVTVYHRGAPLAPAVTIHTSRVRHDLTGADGRPLAEVADDTVEVLDGDRVRSRFREIEVERKAGPRGLLRRVGEVLTAAGAIGGSFVAKHARALGEAAQRPPDLVAPVRRPSRFGSAAEVIAYALVGDITRTLSHDPLVRLRAGVGNGDTAVHQMRVGIRRLRADLTTFAPLLDPAWATSLQDELRWLGGMLGAARDAEVLRARLRRTAALDPPYPLDDGAVARIDADLTAWQEEALVALDVALASPRYVALADTLVAASAGTPTTGAADGSADEVLPGLVARQWRRLVRSAEVIAHPARPNADIVATKLTAGSGKVATVPTGADDADQAWHDVRKKVKRARYSADVAALAVGAPAADLALALAAIADLLGTHQDACVAAQTWLQIAQSAPADRALSVTAARLFERERAAARAARAAYPALWQEARGERMTAWLRRD